MMLTLVASQTVHLQHIKAYRIYKKWKCCCSLRLTLLEKFSSKLKRSRREGGWVGGQTAGTVACFAVDLVHAETETPPGEDGSGVCSLYVKGPEPTESRRSVKERNAESADECLRDRCLKWPWYITLSFMGQWRLVASCCSVCSYAFTLYDLYPQHIYSYIILYIWSKWWPTDAQGGLGLHMFMFSLPVYLMNSSWQWGFLFLIH